MKVRQLFLLCVVFFPGLLATARAADSVFISEFMAANAGSLLDEEGKSSDWIEIHNAGSAAVDLNGWFLTDKVAQLTKWRFPATNLPPNGYLVVFASGNDRRTPGAPLHTNFKLGGVGGYLALVKPDGVTIASAYAPYLPQADGISFGVPVQQMVTALIPSGATARVLVPLNGNLGAAWTMADFDDEGWPAGSTGVGFEADGAGSLTPVTLANSVTEFSGTQGQGNWFYGYWDKKTDANGAYSAADFTPFPNSGGGFGTENYWNGSAWDWFNGDPPFTQLTAEGGRPTGPNANPAAPDHWAIRRYVNEHSGPIAISGRLTHTSDWVYVTATGTAANSLLYLYMTGAGEGYLDDMKIVVGATPEVGANLLPNGDFESGTVSPWTVSANLAGSTVTTAIKHGGARSLRMVSTSAGSSQGTAIWQTIAPGLTVGQTYTLSYWYLPATNNAPLVTRFSGNWISVSPAFCGDGVVGRIFVDGAEVLQQRVFVSSADYSITVPALLGSKVDFVIDPSSTFNNACEGAIFTTKIDTGVGVVADSAADWSVTGTQGERNWFYGYYNKTADPDHTYQAANFTAFPHAPGPQGPNNYWDEEEWDWFSGNPPFDKIGQYWMTPNGTNSGAEHWAIRRWVSEVSGSVSVQWSALKENPDQNNPGGGGVTMRLFHKGIQRDVATVAGGDVTGFRRSVLLTGVQVGDPIDIAVDPTNVDGRPEDDTDRTLVTAVLRGTPSLSSQIGVFLLQMRDLNATAYLRLPFTVDDPSAFNALTLRMKYDDGFVAYLNGVEVARANAPLDPVWNSAATADRADSDNNEWESFNLSSSLGLLRTGTNVLAIHCLNINVADADFLILPELLATTATNELAAQRYFMLPTPGGPNGYGNPNLGPLVLSAEHSPNVPTDAQNLVVTARVAPTFNPVGGVRLLYRAMYSNEVNTAMFDDGLHGDGAPGDGVWGGTIPASASNPGQMVRYYVYATDSLTNATRWPAYEDPKNSPQYQGTVVLNPALTNPLPVLHFFVQNPTLATNYTGTRCSIFWDGEFFDNVEVNAHGQTTWYVFPKRSMDINLNSGHKLRWKAGEDRVKAINLLSSYGDKAYIRLLLSFETFRDSGVPANFAFAVRVQQNNAFHSVAHFVEQSDDDFLKRNGLAEDGAFYKIYFPLTDPYTGAKKLTRKNEPNDDLRDLIAGLGQSGAALRQYLFDHIDVAEAVNFFATIEVVGNEDCCYYKNYYLYRDTPGTGEWQLFPWDLDLTMGRTFTAWPSPYLGQSGGYFDTNIYWMNRWYTQQRSSVNFIGSGQPIFDALWAFPDTQNMFLRRWSSVQERFLQTNNTHPLLYRYEKRIDELTAQIAPDAVSDLAQWGTWPPNPPVVQSQPFAAQVLKTEYLARRRGWAFSTVSFANGGPYLGTQPANAAILLGDIEFNPSSGNQAQEYIQLRNPNNYSVDVSGWKLGGAADFTFKGGTVIPSNGVMYVSPDVKAFRARASGPRGGQGLFVVGGYQGQLSARGETLQLTDSTGWLVRSTNYLGAPSLPQQYLRITEIMFSPAVPPPGLATNADEFEFIELKNIGPDTLDLTGVRFVDGVIFNFTGSAVTSLPPGETTLLVRNLAAFTSRYGGGLSIAGQYTGQLDNLGETLRLVDATGEKILEFSYEPDWSPITDGFGFSLEIKDATSAWNTWGLAASWRTSGSVGGSPGQTSMPPAPFPTILVNELLTHSVPPAVDVVELHNSMDSFVHVGGWFITDDFNTPKKFRIPDNTFIAPHGYLTFDESSFNAPGSPTAFSFSSQGDEVYLFSADDIDGALTGYFHGFSYGAGETAVSFGRHVNSAGQEQFVAQSAPSFLGANAGPKTGPVILSEIAYHPPDFSGGLDNSDDEFIELRNITGDDVTLFDPLLPADTWQLRGDVDYDFPPDLTLPGGGHLLVVNFNPADATRLSTFRARYGVPLATPVVGPYTGKLDNSAGEVRLFKPDAPVLGVVPSILADQVDYRDTAPWPGLADGTGATLQRRLADQHGNDPANWTAAAPTAGAPYVNGDAPVIVSQPANASGLLTGAAALSVAATGADPLRYQWRFGGTAVPGATNATLPFTNLQFNQAGPYNVTVFNHAGSVESSNATLSVQLGSYFTTQPASTNIRAGFNLTLTGFAVSSSPITYQWKLNGTTIPGATGTSLVLTNLQENKAGTYVLLADDGSGPVPSRPAVVVVVFDPIITQSPLSQAVVSGATVVLSVTVTNNATLPVGFRWRRNNAFIPDAFYVLNQRTSYFVISNAAPPAASYNVVITNVARPSGVPISASANVTFLTDGDGDGLPDNWETLYGFNPADGADRDADSDGDGQTNWEEYIAGTDPTDEGSYFKIASIGAGAGATLSFNAVANKTYSVLYAETLPALPAAVTWSRLTDVPARSTNRVETITDPDFKPSRYYRLATPRQP